MALLAGLHHERATDPRVGELLGERGGIGPRRRPRLARGGQRPRAAPRITTAGPGCRGRWSRSWRRTTTIAQQEWVAARKGNDFPRFRPWLEAIFALKRREAECLGRRATPTTPCSTSTSPARQARDLAADFRRPPARTRAAGRRDRRVVPAGRTRSILNRDYPVDRQKVFGEMVAAAVGFDFRRGRLDTTAHPFCSGIGPGDCRITTRYNPRDFGERFFGVLHEVGHGLYEQGLDPEHAGTPMGEAASLGVHESQSRLWENAVGRGRPFWAYWLPVARRVFREALGDVDPEAFHFAINRVTPSLIRVQADEVTYNLHILVRFELERALLGGDLPVGDLPGAWAEVYRKYLGIAPANDAEGCLQDIHWAAGLVGYFPTYTLGNLFAAQLFARANAELGGLDEAFARGDFAGLLGWLRPRIHARAGGSARPRWWSGRRARRPTTGRSSGALRGKYGELYGI